MEWPPVIQGLDWQWQVPRKTVNYHFEPLGNDLFEIIITVSVSLWALQLKLTRSLSLVRPIIPQSPGL